MLSHHQCKCQQRDLLNTIKFWELLLQGYPHELICFILFSIFQFCFIHFISLHKIFTWFQSWIYRMKHPSLYPSHSFLRGNLNLYALFLHCFNVNGYMLTSPPFFLNSRIFHTLSPLCSSHLTVRSLHSST